MNTVFEKLRAARQARGMSLDDVAVATRIRTAILKRVEEGDLSKFPQAYIRAFLRSYAKEVGLEVAEILREYEETLRLTGPSVTGLAEKTVPRPSHLSRPSLNGTLRNNLPLIIAGALVGSLAISLSFFRADKESPDVKEIPFQEVAKQRRIAEQPPNQGRDSAAALPARSDQEATQTGGGSAPDEPAAPLILRAMTFDTVWIRIVIDEEVTKEYIAPPRWNAQWKANDNFAIWLGNGGAVTFTLNNTSLGMLGKPGKAVRNYVIRHPSSSVPQ